nr:gibberellin 3-beta-dioxygenase 1-like [Ipomoea trifida]
MTTLSEAYKEHPLSLEHIIPLDFQSLHKVPDSHLWPKITDDHQKQYASIPTVDLLAPNVVELIGHACETWGMFHVVNHGVSSALVDEVESQAYRLFALPDHQKMKALRSPGGATGYGAARISPFFPKLMWHEGFTMMGSPAHHARQLWPHDHQHFCDTMENYEKKMKALAFKLFLLTLNSIGASEQHLKWLNPSPAATQSEGALQLNSYPRCPNPTHAIGLAPHTDSLFLTILHQSAATGLQVFNQALGWAPVVPVAGALLVNVGDLLHVLSNGRFPTVYHRAVVNESVHRVSVAYFYGPPVDSVVAPVVLRDGDGAPAYRTVRVKDYLSLKAMHLDKALSFIRL